MTERLINKGTNGEFWVSDTDCTRAKGKLQAVMEKLYKYETAEEEGRLVVLPCKVGDAVYLPNEYAGMVAEFKIVEFCMFTDGYTIIDDYGNEYRIKDFGKIIFLTREEAENELKELEGKLWANL